MLIRNARVFTVDGFRRGSIRTCGEVISELGDGLDESQGEKVVDAGGAYAIPGLVDLHLHGALGRDFCEGSDEAIRMIAGFERREGVAAFLCATMAQSISTLESMCEVSGAYEDPEKEGADFLGVNMEAPFISVQKRGAQNAAYVIPPDADLFEHLQSCARGRVRIVGVAPEVDGSKQLVERASASARVSIAHTMANYEQAKAAFGQGARHVTHLFNAMPPLLHRAPGVVGAAWERDDVTAELICDGNFVEPTVVRMALQLFETSRIAMISDGMPSSGLPDGTYVLGGDPIVVADGVGRVERDGALAGPATSLMGVMRAAVRRCGIPLEAAVTCASTTPARILGEGDRYGSLEAGHLADVVLLDDDLRTVMVLFRGREV